MRIAIVTLGCRTNQAESLKFESVLATEGHDVVHFCDSPELCIVNTCSVTSKADKDSRRFILRAIRKGVRTVVTGCYAELHRGDIERTLARHGLEIVRNREKDKLISMIGLNSSKRAREPRAGFRTRPIIKVQEGCNHACSYCIVPLARGPSRSAAVEDVVRDAQRYESGGSREVVLSGIHLGTYGLDLTPPVNLPFLLRELLRETTIPRIRLSSLEIKELDEELLDVLSDTRICRHLHVPIQSGDDTILRLMNRAYTAEEFQRRIEVVLKRYPDLALGTDVIVGFPGEGEEEFARTRNLIEGLPLMYLHVFPYSARPGTTAALLDAQVAEIEKRRRLFVLRQLSARKRTAYIQRYRGRIIDVVVERSDASGLAGTSGNYIKVLLGPERGIAVGMLVDVEITGQTGVAALGVPAARKKVLQ